MEFKHILALVPDDEHFDASAVNEGVWVSTGHLQNIENELATSLAQVLEADQQNQQAIENLNNANTAIETAAALAAEKDQQIAALQAEIETLKAAPAAPITQTVKGKDEKEEKPVQKSEVTLEAERLRALKNKGKK